MIPISTQTISGSTTHQVDFSNIPQDYVDLVIVANGYTATSDISQRIRFNSDSSTNYSLTYVGGDGTNSSSGRTTSGSGIYANYLTGWTSSSTQPSNWVFHVLNYSNNKTYKTSLSRASTPTGGTYPGTEAVVGLWRSTSAITSISVEAGYNGTHYFAAGTTISLYGIQPGTPKAQGGNIVTTDGTYWYHAFTASGTFTPNQSITADILVVGGGGGGGVNTGGGGGAGGYKKSTSVSFAASAYPVIVGAGGNAGISSNVASNGNDSSINSYTSIGGGRGGDANANTAGNGGSGGGAGMSQGSNYNGGTGTSGYGNAGGNSTANLGGLPASGGGGAAAAGTNASSIKGGNGGAGTNTDSTWLNAVNLGASGYAAGGGGGAIYFGNSAENGDGGAGGGGDGGNTDFNTGISGTVSTGGGGGGGRPNGGSGGSGFVIVRYTV